MESEEEYGDFANNFLQSMLEVEMTEEDGVLDVNTSDERQLPPIPTFDLALDTYDYSKGVYRNPLASGSSSPLGPPMISIPASGMSSIISESSPAPIISCQKSSPKMQLIAPKMPISSNVATPAMKVLSDLSKIQYTSQDWEKRKVLNRLFSNDVKKVYVKKDVNPQPLSIISPEELRYYKNIFKEITNISYCKLHCTICDKHIGCSPKAEKLFHGHKMLSVLVCKPCFDFYGDGNFPCDAGDNCEIYCRWCGQGGTQVCCSFCPKVFCKKCVKQNYGPAFLAKIEKADDWACFCCAPKPLWAHRAVYRALIEYINYKKAQGEIKWNDNTVCCDLKKKKSSPIKIQPNGKMAEPQKVRSVSDINKSLTQPQHMHKTIHCGQTTITPPALRGGGGTRPSPSATAPKSTPQYPTRKLTGPSFKGITVTPPKNSTRSTQPARSTARANIPKTTPNSKKMTGNLPSTTTTATTTTITHSVRLTTGQLGDLDTRNMPTVKVPHNAQNSIVRFKFPDNRTQLIRLVMDGAFSRNSKELSTPTFKAKPDPIEGSIADSFRVTKMMFERLHVLNDNISKRSKGAEESIYPSLVKKIHKLLQNSTEIIKEIDENLSKGYLEWTSNKGKTNHVDIIDLSDEESSKPQENIDMTSKILLLTKSFLNDDSDIEIIDDSDTEKDEKEDSSSSKENTKPEKTSDKETEENGEVLDSDNFKLKECSINLVKLPIDEVGTKRKKEEEDDDNGEAEGTPLKRARSSMVGEKQDIGEKKDEISNEGSSEEKEDEVSCEGKQDEGSSEEKEDEGSNEEKEDEGSNEEKQDEGSSEEKEDEEMEIGEVKEEQKINDIASNDDHDDEDDEPGLVDGERRLEGQEDEDHDTFQDEESLEKGEVLTENVNCTTEETFVLDGEDSNMADMGNSTVDPLV